MNRDALEEMLDEHERWLLSDGKEGYRLNGLKQNLSDVDFSGMNLIGVNFSSARLDRANFRDTNLFDANLYCANLTGADLSGANLTGAQLGGANFTDAKLPPSIRHCWNIHHATFPADALPWLILHPKWSDCKDTVKIVNT